MFGALVAAALAFTPADAHLARETANGLVSRHTPRDGGTAAGHRAAVFIRDCAAAVGLESSVDRFSAETEDGPAVFTNVEGVWRCGESEAPWVVFISHFDTKPGIACPGANDGASTTGLLAALGKCVVRERPHGVNVLFIWTDGEESRVAYGPKDGLWGSRHAAKKLKASGHKVLGVFCLDMLGDRELRIEIPANGSPALRRLVHRQARALGLSGCVGDGSHAVRDDHQPFLDVGFRALDLIDFDYGSEPGLNDFWHTDRDTMDKVSEESLLTVGRLCGGILGGLSDECPVKRPKGAEGHPAE